jgi:hypothetical protein
MRAIVLLVVLLGLLSAADGVWARKGHHVATQPKLVATALVAPKDAPEATGKFFVHSSGVAFFQNIVDAIIESDLQDLPLPDDEIDGPLGIKLYLSSIVLKNTVFNAHNISFVSPDQLNLVIDDISGELDLNWHYKSFLLSLSGTATANFADTSINVMLTFDSDPTGKPVVTMSSISVDIESLNVHVSGDGSWLWNAIIGLLKPWLKKIVSGKIQDIASQDFNQILSQIHAKYPLAVPLTGTFNDTVLNLPLVPGTASPPAAPKKKNNKSLRGSIGTAEYVSEDAPRAFSISGEYLVVAGEWGFTSTKNSTADPRPHSYVPDALPASPAGTPPMFGASLDEEFFGSLMWTLTQNGLFDLHLEDKDLPPKSIFHMNTKFISAEYPALYQKYPDMNFTIDIRQEYDLPPIVETTPDGTTITNTAMLTMSVIDPSASNPVIPVMDVRVNLSLSMAFDVLDNTTSTYYFMGDVKPLVIDAAVVWADPEPGTIVNNIVEIISGIANGAVIPIVDEILARGIAMPAHIDVLQMRNVFIAYGNHVFTLGFDLAMPSGTPAAAVDGLRAWMWDDDEQDDQE